MQGPERTNGSPDSSPALLFRSYSKLFVKPPAIARVEATNLTSDTPRLVRQPNKSVTNEEVEEIRQYDLDFILKFSDGIIEDKLLDTARYGVWSFHHGDPYSSQDSPRCFWEIYHNDAVTRAALVRMTEIPGSEVVL